MQGSEVCLFCTLILLYKYYVRVPYVEMRMTDDLPEDLQSCIYSSN